MKSMAKALRALQLALISERQRNGRGVPGKGVLGSDDIMVGTKKALTFPETMKNKGFGHLKTMLFTIKASKNVGFGGPCYMYYPP